MYRTILVTLDQTAADQAVLEHVTRLGGPGQTELVLLHVAQGWASYLREPLKLADSPELTRDRAWLESLAVEWRGRGWEASARVERGNPRQRILAVARERQVEVIAMAGHGHRGLADLFFGSTIDWVRHHCDIPLFIVNARWAHGKRARMHHEV